MEIIMQAFYFALAAFIMLNVILGLLRILRGPSRTDRMLASQFMGTASVALFLILAEAFQLPSLRNIALIFVALAALTTAAFVKAYHVPPQESDS
jgi:multicomponent Na+:H+ antiporter subunit F